MLEPRSLTANQFNEIMQIIRKKNSFGRLETVKHGGKHIKYVRPHIDMRDYAVFCVQFEGLFNDDEGKFDFRDSDRPMYERIMEWLGEEIRVSEERNEMV